MKFVLYLTIAVLGAVAYAGVGGGIRGGGVDYVPHARLIVIDIGEQQPSGLFLATVKNVETGEITTMLLAPSDTYQQDDGTLGVNANLNVTGI